MIWDYLIYAGVGIVVFWLLYAIFSGGRVKVKDSFSVPEVRRSMWRFNDGIPSVMSSKSLTKRLNFLTRRIAGERKLVEESAKLLEARAKKEFLEKFERELKRR